LIHADHAESSTRGLTSPAVGRGGAPTANAKGVLFKFIPPETLERFGRPERVGRAIDASLDRLATFVKNPGRLPELLFGKA